MEYLRNTFARLFKLLDYQNHWRSGLLAMAMVFLLCFSCKDGLFDSGPAITREIKLTDSFSRISVKSIFDIVLVQDSVNKVLVTCGKNLQSYVSVEIMNDMLTLSQDTKFDWSRKYERIKLEVHLITVPWIDVYEPSNITNKGIIKGDNFNIVDLGKFTELDVTVDVNSCGIYMSFDNFGHYTVKGKCVYLDLWEWGSSIIRADSLKAENCSVLHRGIGNVYVNVSNQLKVSLEYSGNVLYSGNPADIIIEEQKSTGKLIKIQ